MENNLAKHGLAVFVAFVSLAAIPYVKAGFWEHGPRPGWVASKGKIVEIHYRTRNVEFEPFPTVRAEFIGPDGSTLEASGDSTRSVGDEVDISYDSSNPRNAVIGDGRESDRLAAILIVALVVALGLAVFKFNDWCPA